MIALPYAHGQPTLSAVIRTYPEDFQVEEILGFEPDEQGEHQLLLVRKRSTNTDWVAKQLARHAKVKLMDVSYAGLKDRHAITTQWFSVRLANKPEPDWQALADDNIEFLRITRHLRKLKRGALKANRFRIRLRNLQGDIASLEQRLAAVAQKGVPNYFGEQRFGYNNLAEAEALLAGTTMVADRHKQKLYLSAARSFLFNEVLAARIKQGYWDSPLAGDVFMLDGTHSIFSIAEADMEIKARLARHDIHPTAPLWGQGNLATTLAALELEQTALAPFPAFCTGLASKGLKQERRAIRIVPKGLSFTLLEMDQVQIEFELPAGSYATAVLREICHYTRDLVSGN